MLQKVGSISSNQLNGVSVFPLSPHRDGAACLVLFFLSELDSLVPVRRGVTVIAFAVV